jgi:glycerophosphoryl diester phosphodiesterase
MAGGLVRAIQEHKDVDGRDAAGHDVRGAGRDVIATHITPAAAPRRCGDPQLPPVIGHRGAAARAPENTLAGLRRARELGCAWVEFDVRLTRDGAAVLCHDPRLDRTTDGNGLVSTHTLAEIRTFDGGGWFAAAFSGEKMPTLDEALLLCAELGLGANIELKAEHGREYATAAAVAAALRRLGARPPPVLVSSFLVPALAALLAVAPQIARGVLFRLVPRHWAEIAARFDCSAIGVDHRRLLPRRAAAIRAAGYQLAAYTVNDPGRARLLYDWGVTSVFADVPDIILRANGGGRTAPQLGVAPLSLPPPPAGGEGRLRGAVAPVRPALAREGAFR